MYVAFVVVVAVCSCCGAGWGTCTVVGSTVSLPVVSSGTSLSFCGVVGSSVLFSSVFSGVSPSSCVVADSAGSLFVGVSSDVFSLLPRAKIEIRTAMIMRARTPIMTYLELFIGWV